MTAPVSVRLRADVESPDDIDLLYWVGCCVSADDRVSSIARSVARILDAAGVRFAVLGGEEQCCGDPARRTGNEFHFEALARANIETLQRYGVKRILAHCPHCLHVLRNEYPRFGGNFEVMHHTELIAELVAQGKLRLAGPVPEPLTYQDPCYLARYAGVVKAPRAVLKATGARLTEMRRSGTGSFCCGGGGGHSFFESDGGRINRLRAREALATGTTTVCTACPYCLSMMEDGLRVEGADQVAVKDVAELVAALV